MKRLFLPVLVFAIFRFPEHGYLRQADPLPEIHSANIVVITIDGFRWQELFTGADPDLISDPRFTKDTSTMKMLYWSEDVAERRKMLLPFMWNVVSKKGKLLGNRAEGNHVNIANRYALSYPGYNEILTGYPDPDISSNKKFPNPNKTVLEHLQNQPAFHGKVAVFSSWDVFPYIVNAKENNIYINSGYQPTAKDNPSSIESLINTMQANGTFEEASTRHDQLTFLNAREYMRSEKPRVVLLGLGETDEFAHAKRYDLYLHQANQTDRMIGELWHWIQTTPGYKDNTTLVITTDHGRGKRDRKWHAHGPAINGSSETWLAMLGPNLPGAEETPGNKQHYQWQLAAMIASVGKKE